MLLSSADFRDELSALTGEAESYYCYSAFLSLDAVTWLLQHRAGKTIARFLVRGLPADFLAGACSFQALQSLLDAGTNIKFSSAWHGKVYVADGVAFLGSANATASGLALNTNANDELGTKVVLASTDIDLLERIWASGVCVTEEKLAQYESYLQELKNERSEDRVTPHKLPEHIFAEKRGLYCGDFPVDLEKLEPQWCSFNTLSQTRAYEWLISQVRASGGDGCSFGALSAALHDAIYDDPTPYRSTIKQLLSNLLKLVELKDDKLLSVQRPRHSQVVTLR